VRSTRLSGWNVGYTCRP